MDTGSTTRTCPHGHENPEGFSFCGTCGLSLDLDRAVIGPVEDLAEVVSIEVVDLEAVDVNPDEAQLRPRVNASFCITNHAEQDVRAVTGWVFYSDVFDRPRAAYSLTLDADVLPAGSVTTETTLGIDVDVDNVADRWLLEHVGGHWSAHWKPDAILFTDGTMLGEIDDEDD
jgi:hypothetical protein